MPHPPVADPWKVAEQRLNEHVYRERLHALALVLNKLYHLQVDFPEDESLDEAIEYTEALTDFE